MRILIATIFALFFALSAFAQKQAEVVVTSTHLRKAPDYSAEKIQTLQKGEKVTLEKARETKGWHFVSILNGAVKGWIRSDTVRPIKAEEKVSQASVQTTPKEKTTGARSEKTSVQTPPKVVPAPTPTKNTPNSKPIANASTPKTVAIETLNPNPSPVASPTPEPVEEDKEIVRVETEEVSLNVRVVNGQNRPVNNLNLTDFQIYEDEVLQPITSLKTTEVPIVNALVIDNSRSLRLQLKKVIEAGKIIVGANRPNDQSAIVRFVSSDKIEVVQDFTQNKILLNDALNNLFVEGGQTAIIDAVYQTAKKVEQYQNSQKKEDVKLRALILVSDGDDRGSSYDEQQLFKLLRESNVQIYAIGFVNDLSNEAPPGGTSRHEKAKVLLTRLAKETGGKVYFPTSIEELPQIAADISAELRTQYVISYSPTNEARDGGFRKIKVVVADGANKEKRIAVTRTGRNAPQK